MYTVSERFCRDELLKVHGERQLLKQEGRVMPGTHFAGNSGGGGGEGGCLRKSLGL